MLRPTPSIPPSRAPSPLDGNARRPCRRASIALIGMPGVGKTTLASITAKALGWEMLDTDVILETRHQMTISEFIASRGLDALRKAESEVLADVLHSNLTEKVIACGSRVSELEENRAVLKKFRDQGQGLVIHVIRDKESVAPYLRRSAAFKQDPNAWESLAAFYRECCSFEFPSLTVQTLQHEEDVSMEDSANELSVIFKPVEKDFFRLLRFIHGVDTNKVPTRGHRTYFLTLTYDDVNQAIPHLEDLSVGLDLWAIRGDLMASYDLNYLSFQVATLRRHSALPLMFIIRTKSELGKYPDVDTDNTPLLDSLTSYYQHALRLGIEYVELKQDYPRSVIENIVPIKGSSSIIGTCYDQNGTFRWDCPEAGRIYDSIVNMGADVATMIFRARSFEDNMSLQTFASSVEKGPIPLVAINLGIEGKISRALNPYLTPVSHPLLPIGGTTGHLTFQECQSILYLTGLLRPKKFYVFGHPIPHSMSPVLHNTAFAALGLPHSYSKLDTASVDEIRRMIECPDFGGASVTLPHARNVIPLIQRLSRHAQIIGAVNTIYPVPHGGHELFGDNTDWRGIKNCLLRSLTPAHTVTSSTTALVLGAGGSARATIYALYRIGVVNIFVYNRSGAKAKSLVYDFQRLDHLLRIKVLDSLALPLPINPQPTIIVSTVPVFAGAADSESPMPVDIGLRLDHLSMNGGVALELAYEKRTTLLLELAERRRLQGSQWVGVEGIEVLLEQGFEQCKMWTGRRAPVTQVRAKVLEVYDEMISTCRN